MQRRFFIGFGLAVFGLAGLVHAADKQDPTGTWKWKVTIGDRDIDMTLKLKLEKEELSGTISGRAGAASDNIGYTAGEVGVADLLHGIDAPAGIALLAEQVAQVDSKDMSFAIWRTLAQRCAHWLAAPDVAGLVITHGTDTLEETAFFLQSVLAPSKPVVML